MRNIRAGKQGCGVLQEWPQGFRNLRVPETSQKDFKRHSSALMADSWNFEELFLEARTVAQICMHADYLAVLYSCLAGI